MGLRRCPTLLLLAIAAASTLRASVVLKDGTVDSQHPVPPVQPIVAPVADNGGTKPTTLQEVFNPDGTTSSYTSVNIYDANGLLFTPLVTSSATAPDVDLTGVGFVLPSKSESFSLQDFQVRFAAMSSPAPVPPPFPGFTGGNVSIANPEPVSGVVLASGLLAILYLRRRWRHRPG